MKKIITYITISSIIIAGGYFGYKKIYPTNTTSSAANRSIIVGTGSIKNIVKATGKVYPVQESNLTFTKQGTITGIYKKIGDTVQSGDLIAELDAKNAKLDVANAKINLSNAQNNLNKILEGSSEINKIKAENTLNESKAKLTLLEKQYESQIEQQKNTINTNELNIKSLEEKLLLAENDLKYTQENIDTTTTTNNIERDVANAYSLIESSYQIIAPSLKTLSDTLLLESQATTTYGAIGENNPALKLQMEKLYTKIKENNDSIQNTMTEVRGNSNSLTTILVGLTQIRTHIGDLSSLTALTVSVLRASKTGVDLPSDFLDKKIETIESLNNSVSSKYASINSTIATLKNYGNDSIQDLANNNSISSKKIALNSAYNELAKAKIALEELKKTHENNLLLSQQNIEAQKNAIKLNEASYRDIMTSSNTDIVSAKNSIQSAQISLQKAELTLKDYQIYATFDGIIKDIPWVVGDTVTTSSTTSSENISITNSGGYEIRVSLDQVDIVKIRAGMPAKIAIDAYANSSFTGIVSSVSPTPVEASNVVSYTAKILLPKIDQEIYSNMSATVQIIIDEKNDILLVPIRATKSEKGKTYVQVVTGNGENTTTTQTEVVTGSSDDTNIEILSGLSAGQRLRIQTSTATGTSSSSSTRSGGFGGGVGGPPF